MPNTISDLSVAQLKRAIQIKEQINKLQSELGSLPGFKTSARKPAASSSMSAATRVRMSNMAKARWAKIKRGSRSATKNRSSGRSTLSAAARQRISEAAKARWAKIKSGNKGSGVNTAATATAKARKPMSAARRAQLAAAMKERWAKIKANKGTPNKLT